MHRRFGPHLFAILLSTLLSGCVTLAGQPLVPAASGPLGLSGVGISGNGVADAALSGLPRDDRARALAAEYQALETQPVGEAVAWQGRKASGSVSALAPFQVGSQNCRQLIHTLDVEGEARTERGSACREPDGTWTPLT